MAAAADREEEAASCPAEDRLASVALLPPLRCMDTDTVVAVVDDTVAADIAGTVEPPPPPLPLPPGPGLPLLVVAVAWIVLQSLSLLLRCPPAFDSPSGGSTQPIELSNHLRAKNRVSVCAMSMPS